MQLIDSHTHFDDERFNADRDAAYERARAAGVSVQVLAGVCAHLWPQLKTVVATYPGLYASYGLHPMYLGVHRPRHLQELAQWLEQERPVAVGECGLDYLIPDMQPERQVEFFTEQLRIARDHDLPVIVHARRAVDDVIKYIRRFPGSRGVVHSFSGSEQQAERLYKLGFLTSFGGPLTYPRANRLRRLIKKLPLESFMLETDAPDQPGAQHQGERNEPAYLPEVLAVVAELRAQDPAEIAAATTRNAMNLFGIEPCSSPSPAPKS